MACASKPFRAFRRNPIALFAMTLSVVIAATFVRTPAKAQTSASGQSITVPSLPYPKSGLRQRLIADGKSIPDVDESLQADIPALYFEPNADNGTVNAPYPAVVALPDCDNHFPKAWISTLQKSGYAVLLISPPNAHPTQDYCGGGHLQTPKHGLSYWAFDAISALYYLSEQKVIDPENIAVFGYGYGAGAGQLAIYRDGHAKHYQHRFNALVGLRPQCMSEMDNFVPSLLVGVKNDPFNPPAWCHWRIDRDLKPNRQDVTFKTVESSEKVEDQTTRRQLSVETNVETVTLISDFLSRALSK
ncbi:alpha/beta hydrolase [Thalassospira sp. HF15]|uniref:alpha/beta hydrolase n=1 Tax=Thalassospira sp. HF15 TaxID=2722755 RepID=UPI001430AD1C|nr:alpha/beta hydrolase [Thalassospira sp. HF15]NIY76240.1 alpha/beta hydrolase [Thalassospira sp. HF15]